MKKSKGGGVGVTQLRGGMKSSPALNTKIGGRSGGPSQTASGGKKRR